MPAPEDVLETLKSNLFFFFFILVTPKLYRFWNSNTRPVVISVYNFSIAVFGLGLCSQFDISSRPAPLLVERCTSALEEKASEDSTLDLYKVYHSSPPNEQTLELRQKLNEGKFMFISRSRADQLGTSYQPR